MFHCAIYSLLYLLTVCNWALYLFTICLIQEWLKQSSSHRYYLFRVAFESTTETALFASLERKKSTEKHSENTHCRVVVHVESKHKFSIPRRSTTTTNNFGYSKIQKCINTEIQYYDNTYRAKEAVQNICFLAVGHGQVAAFGTQDVFPRLF